MIEIQIPVHELARLHETLDQLHDDLQVVLVWADAWRAEVQGSSRWSSEDEEAFLRICSAHFEGVEGVEGAE